MDRFSRLLITICGLGTILAVSTVFLYLFWVVIPLFWSAHVEADTPTAPLPRLPLHVGIDDAQMIGWALAADGTLEIFRLDTGAVLEKKQLFEKGAPTAQSQAINHDEMRDGLKTSVKQIAFGFADGRVRLGKFGFKTTFLEKGQVPPSVQELHVGEVAPFRSGMITPTSQGQYRLEEVEIDLPAASKPLVSSRAAIERIDHSKGNVGGVICVLSADGQLILNTVREQTNFATGEIMIRPLRSVTLPYQPPKGLGKPDHVLLSGLGDQVYLIWKNGMLQRIDARNQDKPQLAETVSLTENDAEVTALRFLIGKTTLMVGDSHGQVRAWFLAEATEALSTDSWKFVCGHTLQGPAAPVTALAASDRTRLVLAGFANGEGRLSAVTSEKLLATVTTQGGVPVQRVLLAPRDDAILLISKDAIARWNVDPRHPEITLGALFKKVWYEGRSQPEYVWESSSGDDAFEPKYSLIPLIFGTLKGSFYSLLFGVPLALLAAIYTSEFMHPRAKALIKPTIELMASLPSVVLGFLAGLVFAQFVERVVPTILACFACVPFAFIAGAYLWQVLPEKIGASLARWRFAFICLVLPIGLGGGWLLGPVFERWLFNGDLRRWLDTGEGSGFGGWMFLLVPLSAILVSLLIGTRVNPWLRRLTRDWPRSRVALVDLAKMAGGMTLTLGLAALGSSLLSEMQHVVDPRHSWYMYLGPYTQRNALVVGFVMGFAIIPIIYTISEDALSAVPSHLRSASLAAGATPWQTAIRIVIPTAMSGLFSAVMIGLGRAVGETMIVLMATGNTPILEMNIFNGFRTLSANIAVELPEAVKDSTHYRTLYLAALTLLLATFVLNTIAEMVRLRFRRRAFQL